MLLQFSPPFLPPLISQLDTKFPPLPGKQKKKKMVRFEGALLCLMVMIIDLIAGILGIQAEIAQNKVDVLDTHLNYTACGETNI